MLLQLLIIELFIEPHRLSEIGPSLLNPPPLFLLLLFITYIISRLSSGVFLSATSCAPFPLGLLRRRIGAIQNVVFECNFGSFALFCVLDRIFHCRNIRSYDFSVF